MMEEPTPSLRNSRTFKLKAKEEQEEKQQRQQKEEGMADKGSTGVGS